MTGSRKSRDPGGSQARILLCCYEVPGYGGAATATYSLFRMLRSDGLDIHLVSIVNDTDFDRFRDQFGPAAGDPEGLGNTHVCRIPERVFGAHDTLARCVDEIEPDVMVGFGTIASYALASLNRKTPLIHCTTGFSQLDEYLGMEASGELIEFGAMLEAAPDPDVLHPQEAEVFEQADLVVTHSDCVLDLCYRFFPPHREKIFSTPIWFFDWITTDVRRFEAPRKTFRERRYDMIFVASDWTRAEKNYALVKTICAAFPGRRIQVVGRYPAPVDGVLHHDFVADRARLFSLMADSRVLVCPSLQDAAPGVLWEAVEAGCNTVASRNCGNWMLCPSNLLATSMDAAGFTKAIEAALSGPLDHDMQWFRDKQSYQRIKQLLLDYGRSAQLFGPIHSPSRRVAYHLWHYPILSETFIQREIAAVRRRGVPVLVIAESRDKTSADCDSAVQADPEVTYLNGRGEPARHAITRLFFNNPVRLWLWYTYTRMSRYHASRGARFNRETFVLAMRLASVLRSRNACHVHAPWSDRNAFIAHLAARMARIGYSAQARAHDIHRTGYAGALRATLRGARFIITNTRYNLEHLNKVLPWTMRRRLKQIYNGLDLARFPPRRAVAGSPPIRLLSVGRITPQKGFTDLLRACARLRDLGCSFELDIVGAPEMDRCADYFEEVTDLRTALHLEDYVTLDGAQPLPRVIELYNAADIFVLPCVVDTDGSRDIIPNVILEAMAVGLPVVATRLAGIPEMVEHDISAILVPPGDPGELAGALHDLMGDPEKRRALGANARVRVETRFDIDRNAHSYAVLFQDAAARMTQPVLRRPPSPTPGGA